MERKANIAFVKDSESELYIWKRAEETVAIFHNLTERVRNPNVWYVLKGFIHNENYASTGWNGHVWKLKLKGLV